MGAVSIYLADITSSQEGREPIDYYPKDCYPKDCYLKDLVNNTKIFDYYNNRKLI